MTISSLSGQRLAKRVSRQRATFQQMATLSTELPRYLHRVVYGEAGGGERNAILTIRLVRRPNSVGNNGGVRQWRRGADWVKDGFPYSASCAGLYCIVPYGTLPSLCCTVNPGIPTYRASRVAKLHRRPVPGCHRDLSSWMRDS